MVDQLGNILSTYAAPLSFIEIGVACVSEPQPSLFLLAILTPSLSDRGLSYSHQGCHQGTTIDSS